jgi:hypothetical protein
MVIWFSRTAWRDDGLSTRGVAVAEARPTVSPDRWTSLVPAEWSGPTRRARAVRPGFVGERGALSRDDTVMPTPFATARARLSAARHRQRWRPAEGLCEAGAPAPPACSAYETMAGLSSAGSSRPAAAMASPCGSLGLIPPGRSPVGCLVGSRAWWSAPAPRTRPRIA